MRSTLLTFIAIVLSSISALAQKEIEDDVFKQWTSQTDNAQYFLLLNPNAACFECHKKEIRTILENSRTYGNLCVVTYNELIELSKVNKTRSFCLITKDKTEFQKLSYLRYRDGLIKLDHGQLSFVSKITTSNIDSLSYFLSK